MHLLELGHSLGGGTFEMPYEAEYSVKLGVLPFEVKVHHLCDKAKPVFEEVHELLLHGSVKFAVIALD